MALTLYLAMTAAEMHGCSQLPENMAWMACHFSPYSSDLSNIPRALPPKSVLILNDRIPPHGHDPQAVAEQLSKAAEELSVSRVLLDFQRPECSETAAIAKAITHTLPCPVAVTPAYAKDLSCAVFLTPALRQPLQKQLSLWPGREIWLEAATDCEVITVTETGSEILPGPIPENPGIVHTDRALCCQYCLNLEERCARFTVWRDHLQLQALLDTAAGAGVTCAVGLYQQLHK